MRLIDADALRKEFPENYEKPLWHFTGIWAAIDVAETVDPVKHGYWKEVTLKANGSDCFTAKFCSVCGCSKYPDENFCSNCGAKMNEEKTNDGI